MDLSQVDDDKFELMKQVNPKLSNSKLTKIQIQSMKANHLKDKAVLTQQVSLIQEKMMQTELRERAIKDSYKMLVKMIQSGEKVKYEEVDSMLMSSIAGSQLLDNYENLPTGRELREGKLDETLDSSRVRLQIH